MGKIRIKSFDESSVEDEAKLKAKKEAKKAEKMAAKNAAKAENAEVEEVKEATVEEVQKETEAESAKELAPSEAPEKEEKKKAKKEKFVKAKAKVDSKRHKANLTVVSRTQSYDIDQALSALKKFTKSKFDETVELHINTKEKGVSGQVVLPHGTGKTLVIKIADEALLSEVAKGKINFDVLVAAPSMMPNLARVAKVLGPRGLMPNPKNGTIAENPEDAVKKLSGGQISYKTESEAPIIHARVGKLSFDDNKLKENIDTFITSVGKNNIVSVTLKSTMSPGIKLA